jgi:hypothetical protein
MMVLLEVGVWAMVMILVGIGYIAWGNARIVRDQHQALMVALASLGDTHKLGYDGVMLTLQRLETRVTALEERR